MSYSSNGGRRPNEYASKSAHTQIINDSYVKDYLAICNFPKSSDEVSIDSNRVLKINEEQPTSIKYIVAVDGGYDTVAARKKYPSASLAFFQFGALMFKVDDLVSIEEKAYIQPEDMQRLKQMERLKLALPIRFMTIGNEKNLIDSVRKSMYDFFMNKPRKVQDQTSNFMKTLCWLIYSEYKPRGLQKNEYTLGNCPNCGEQNIILDKTKMHKDFTFTCPASLCGEKLYLTDVFRLHEAIDNELGAGGILGYVTSLMEQWVIIDLVRTIVNKNRSLLNETLFIKDGPLGFFGQTANMFKLVRELLNYLQSEGIAINMAGIEKSGVFVEHAKEISDRLNPGTILMLGNEYIYGNILPSKEDITDPYAGTSYYSGKLFYKTEKGQMYVVTIPTSSSNVYLEPERTAYMNLENVLINLAKLKCDMYDNALFPVALANKLVSLSSHPSSTILENFFREATGQK